MQAKKEESGYCLCGLKDKNGSVLTPAEHKSFSILGEYAVGAKWYGSDVFNLQGELLGNIDKEIGYLCGDDVIKVQTGEPGEYTQQLYNLKGQAISEKFDRICFFHNGIALIENDGKIGLISSTGETILEPTIQYDNITYFDSDYLFTPYYIEEDSFYISVAGELAIINIIR